MEKPGKYFVERSLYRATKKEEVLHSAYYQSVASTADSMIVAGSLLPGREEELIERAIAFTDKLIERVGEKL